MTLEALLTALASVLLTVNAYGLKKYHERIEAGFHGMKKDFEGIRKSLSGLSQRVAHIEGQLGIKTHYDPEESVD